ncbi:unnamed protein product [Closterium sp. NIES-54]
MGHVALPILQQLVKNEMVAGIHVKGEPDEVLGCPTCMQAKFSLDPFTSSESTVKAPLDEVVMDMVGPLKFGAAGAEYFLTIVDVYTRMNWVYVLSKKSDVAETVKTDWLPMVEQQHDRFVKAIRTDQGEEFLSKDFSLWLKKSGIRHSLTMPYSPAMNGIVERANRTITETARGFLIEAGLPDYFWPDAVWSTFKPPQVAASAQVSASGQVAPPCSCRLLSHQTLLWYHRLGHPSLPRLRGMHSHLLVSDLPRSPPPLPPSRALPCLSCVKGRQRAALQSFSFPVMTIPFRLSTWTCGGQLASVDRAARATFCCVFLGLPPDAPSWQFYHPTSRRVFPFQEVMFDESVPFYGLFTYSYAPPPPLPPFLAPGPPPVDPLAPQGAAQGAASGGAGPRGAEFEGGAQPEGVEAGGAESEGAESGGAEPQGTASSRGLKGSSPRLSTGLSLSAPPSDESVESSGPYPQLVGCLMYLMTCTPPDLVYPLSLLDRYVAPERHRKVHWDVAKRVLRYLCSTSGMGLVLGGRGPVVLTETQTLLGSSCEAEIYAGAMAAQELRWLTYVLTDLGEQPRSPLVLYVENKAMIALCQEH